MRARFLDQRGFSLAELLIATAVVGLTMAGVFVLQRGGQQAYLFGANRVETQQNARVALDLMTRELRSATQITAVSCSGFDLTFVWKDEADASHTIRYWLSGTTLNRTYDGTTTPLIGGVASLTAAYFPTCNASKPSDVTRVRLTLQTRTEDTVAAGSPGDARAQMQSDVTLRSAM